ncbi:putative transposase [Ilyonectria robusta]
MPKYTIEAIQAAIQDVGNGTSLRRAANRHGVPYSTLRGRINGTESRNEAHRWRQLLHKHREKQLCKWLIFQDKPGMALTHGQIRKLVISLLGENSRNQAIGKHLDERIPTPQPANNNAQSKGN